MMRIDTDTLIIGIIFFFVLLACASIISYLVKKLEAAENLLRKSISRNRATDSALKDILDAFEDGPAISHHNASKKILSLTLARTVVKQQAREGDAP